MIHSHRHFCIMVDALVLAGKYLNQRGEEANRKYWLAASIEEFAYNMDIVHSIRREKGSVLV